jgi:vacuolar-type H+-ATPase subunit I/STV1
MMALVAGACNLALHNALSSHLSRLWPLPRKGRPYDKSVTSNSAIRRKQQQRRRKHGDRIKELEEENDDLRSRLDEIGDLASGEEDSEYDETATRTGRYRK